MVFFYFEKMDDYLAEHAPEPTSEERDMALLRFFSEYDHLRSTYELYLTLKGDRATKADPNVVASLPRMISKDINSSSQCTICLNHFGESDPNPEAEVMVMPCQHKFHSSCLKMWLDRASACPLCRKDLPSDDEFIEELKKKIDRSNKRQADIDELHDSMYM
ncbi:E3 ubiquitin-protein ligase RNF181 [Strongyloides ratti]|uniref:E3 ubiquitin-protein ligase RNF181 n=1 Tax=Strongyloides ratti TaxID=34506 RepID=A0A090LI14_STRRB|nr:E3 ubiquitin-protein ligase RNF181 [Strongyloides ratti]CEF69382.1 E3 ubiquitin-protein ligase RNF181 [Strongyloides ratti]